MAQGSPNANRFFNSDFMKKMMPSGSTLPFDFSSMLEIQRRNFQAVGEVQKTAIENMQAIAQRQAQILSQMVEYNMTIVQQIMGDGTPEEKVSRQTDMVRDAYERSVTSFTELADLVSKSNRETGDVISKRVTASLTEFKSSVEKTAEQEAA